MKVWRAISDFDLEYFSSRSEVLAQLGSELAPGGWVCFPAEWRPGPPGCVYVKVDIPESPEGLLL